MLDQPSEPDRLGIYQRQFDSFRATIAGQRDAEGKWTVFKYVAEEAARLVAGGMTKTIAVDELMDIARAHSLPEDDVNIVVGDAFTNEENQQPSFEEKPWDWTYGQEKEAPNNNKSRGNGQAPQPPPVNIKIESSAEFVAGFVPPEYLVVGLLQRRFFYALTALTGHGKTAVMLILAAAVALGIRFAGKETKKTRVLYLAAENADDVRMRWIALAECMNFDINTIEVYFVKGRFTLSQAFQSLRAESEKRGGEFGLVMVDTGPTFFEGKEENENKQAGDHARMLRNLIETIPGRPCVLAACHPAKHAGPEDLLPRGGGAFLNEVDGNLTCWKTDSTVEVGTQGKFRGPDFAPMNFLIRTVTTDKLKDSDGRHIPTVVADHISDEAKETIAAAARSAEDAALKYIADNPSFTQASLATAMQWTLYTGEPHKSRAARVVRTLVNDKLIKPTRTGRFTVTPEGRKVLNPAATDDEAEPKKPPKGEELRPALDALEASKPKREDWYRDLSEEERADFARRIAGARG